MRKVWTRQEIEARVDELREGAPTGADFADAVKRFSTDELGPAERPVLRELLLERAALVGHNLALERRLAEGGWFRRTMRRLDDALDSRRRSPDR
jgi:hypothetical protein